MSLISLDALAAMVLASHLYGSPHGRSGGCLHVVLDDGNTLDRNIAYCCDFAQSWDDELYEDDEIEGHELCVPLANLLLDLNDSEREFVCGLGYHQPCRGCGDSIDVHECLATATANLVSMSERVERC